MQRLFTLLLLCLLGMTGHLTGQINPTLASSENTAVIPFFPFSDLILVRGIADGKEGYFILDTGASGLILNKKYFQAERQAGDEYVSATGINGEVRNVQRKEVRLELGRWVWKNLPARLYDLAYLEEVKGISIVGLLGCSLFFDMELTVDFQESRLLLSRLDDKGNRFDNVYPRSPDVTVPFRQKGHMPFIEAEVEGNLLNLGIDSGAGIGLIVHKKQTALLPFTEPADSIQIRGLEQQIVKAMSVYLKNLTVANLSYVSLKIAFADLNRINREFAGPNLDGILGLDLLSQHQTTLNFKKKEIYIWTPENSGGELVLRKPRKVNVQH